MAKATAHGPISLAAAVGSVGGLVVGPVPPASLIRLCLSGNTPVVVCFERPALASALVCNAHTTQTSVSLCKIKRGEKSTLIKNIIQLIRKTRSHIYLTYSPSIFILHLYSRLPGIVHDVSGNSICPKLK